MNNNYLGKNSDNYIDTENIDNNKNINNKKIDDNTIEIGRAHV